MADSEQQTGEARELEIPSQDSAPVRADGVLYTVYR